MLIVININNMIIFTSDENNTLNLNMVKNLEKILKHLEICSSNCAFPLNIKNAKI